MRSGAGRRGASCPVLAAEWSLAVATVEGMAVEAWRALVREVADPAKVREDVAAVLMRDVHRASDAAEFAAVARLGDVLTRVTGARAPEEHTIKSDLSTLTDEQIEQRAKALVAKLGKKA